MDIVPSSPEYLIYFIEAIAYQVSGAAVYPFDEIGKFRKGGGHKESMGKLGIGEPVIILTDEPVQIGSTTARIGYDKDRFFDPDLPVPGEKHLVQQSENKVQELIEEKLKDKKYRQQPYTQVKSPVCIIDDAAQDTEADIIKTGGEIFHMLVRTRANERYFNNLKK
jgi:hypothetical protein